MSDDEDTNRGSHQSRGGKKNTNGKKPAKPKKVTAAYLERAALHYLGRFNSSEKNLKDVLERKVRRRNENHAPASEEQKDWIADVVKKCVGYDYIDDKRYAAQRAEMLLRRGKPVRMIKQDLRHKGISSEISSVVLAELEGEEPDAVDRRAAAAYIKRRRFGPFRRMVALNSEQQETKKQKELASMARAGFAYTLASEMLNLTTDEIIDLLT